MKSRKAISNLSSRIFTIPSDEVYRSLGKRYAELVNVYKYDDVITAANVYNGLIEYNSTQCSDAVLDLIEEKNTLGSFNRYGNLLTEDFCNVIPIIQDISFMSALEKLIPEHQSGNISTDNWLIFLFKSDKKYFNILKWGLTSIFVGALPSYKIKNMAAMFNNGQTTLNISYLMETGWRSELRPLIRTIGKLDLPFTYSDISYLKNFTESS